MATTKSEVQRVSTSGRLRKVIIGTHLTADVRYRPGPFHAKTRRRG
jgi:hypothetical protein